MHTLFFDMKPLQRLYKCIKRRATIIHCNVSPLIAL